MLAAWAAPIIAALAGFVVARLSKGQDARSAAEAALIGSGPQIINEQSKRITELMGEVDRLWKMVHEAAARERECFERLYRLEVRISQLEDVPLPPVRPLPQLPPATDDC